MSDIKTVSVISKDAGYHGGQPFTINESDFDAKLHKLANQEDADDSPEDLEALTVAELRALALGRGIELKGTLTKAAIIEAIEAK